MKPSTLLAATALLALAACGSGSTATDTATATAAAAPADLKSQVMAMDVSTQPVFAWQQLVAYQHAHPEANTSPCTSIRRAEADGVIPDNVAPDSIYAQFKGQVVFAVQCGPQLTTVRSEPKEHWLVAFPDGATAATVVNCADAHGKDQCVRPIPTAATAAAP